MSERTQIHKGVFASALRQFNAAIANTTHVNIPRPVLDQLNPTITATRFALGRMEHSGALEEDAIIVQDAMDRAAGICLRSNAKTSAEYFAFVAEFADRAITTIKRSTARV